jgi:hypothetical protein
MLLEVGVLSCIILFNLIEQSSLSVRVYGASVGALPIGHHLSLIIMLVNRVSSALALLFLGYAVDIGIGADALASLFALAGLILGVISNLAIKRWEVARWTFRLLYRVCYNKAWVENNSSLSANAEVDYDHSPSVRLRVKFVYVSSVLLFIGFLVPSIIASVWPDLRATLMQTGFVLNAFGSLIVALYVEKDIATIFQGLRPNEIERINSEMAAYKSYAYVTGALLFLILGPLVV